MNPRLLVTALVVAGLAGTGLAYRLGLEHGARPTPPAAATAATAENVDPASGSA